ncbi:flagellar filament capping protein FliD [Pilimelia columellifera]|uniref:Flagellar hook-associated protein 2 n=1 Tax=Pilimelia columellifera subsp. columellifera TaxID=706583 RepID=A0ABN3N801_9ACTN
MGSMSIDGIVSGLGTGDLINQLMQIEALPQTALKKKVDLQGKVVTSLQGVNSKFATMMKAAKDLSSADIWGAMKATSSSNAAIATAGTNAIAGSLTFKVDSLAAAHTVTFAGRVAATTDAVISGASLDVQLADGTTTTVNPASQSLTDVVKAINNTANAAYTAAAVQTSPGQFALQLTAKETGAANAFTAPPEIDGLGAQTISTQGSDAQITVGTGATYTVTSETNVFENVLPGVTITAVQKQAAADAPVSVTIGADASAVADKVKALVDAANAALTEISVQTRTKNGTASGGALAGDSTMRKLAGDILSAIGGGGGAALGSYSQVGIQASRDGSIAFDKQKFLDAYQADPTTAQKFFDDFSDVPHANATADVFNAGWDTANGLARKLDVIGRIASEGLRLPTTPPGAATEGLLPGLIKRKNESIGDLNDLVASWDLRLETRRTTLSRQFNAMEVALGKMKSQSSWLSGQLSSLSG